MSPEPTFQQLAEEHRFQLLVDSVTDYAIYMMDSRGFVSSWNSGAHRLKGYSLSEILGQPFSRFFTPEDRAVGLPERILETAASEGRAESEGWRIRKDGSRFWALAVVHAIRGIDGDLIGFAKITRDITERREAQLALQRTQAQQAYAQRMEALGQLTGGVAHDFNNLLMIIGGHLRTVKTLVADDPRGRRAATAIEIAAQRAESLTRQLLSYSRRQTLQPIVVDVATRVDVVRQVVAGSLGGATLVDRIRPGVGAIRVDVSEFDLALVNLALNARDAMPDGGQITIAAKNVALDGDETPASLRGDFVAITVSDTGTGIPPDIVPKVFDPFFTTKGADKGTGLGLSQVHGFVHQSGGTVTIASELGRGTHVTLYLPRAAAAAANAEPAATADIARGAGTALLVEDNPEVAEVTRAMLADLGYRVHLAADAEAARALLAAHDYVALISDIVMAGDMDGLALARAVRAARPTLPILLATGYSHALDEGRGEFAVLRKPFQLNDLGRALAAATALTGPPADLVELSRHRGRRANRPRE